MNKLEYYGRDLLHYIMVFGLLSITWVAVMYFTNMIALVWFINLIMFIIFDKIAHILFGLK